MFYNIQVILRRGLFGFLLLLTITFAVWRTFPPRSLPSDAPAEVFSAGRAVETLQVIARSPRSVGSAAYETARYYLLTQLVTLGMSAETQDLAFGGVWVENTLGRLPGRSSKQAILLVAHLDSVAGTPGAMDNASGVAEVLETVRALRAGPALENTIIVLFTGPEENCCYGAGAFVRRHPWARDVRLVINTDAGGVSGPSILAATGPQEGWLIREMADSLPHPLGSSAIEAFGNPATDYSLEFRRDGFPGVDFNLSWTKRIHTPLDNLANINPASIQHQGEHLLAVARHFGNMPLDFPSEPRPVYFDLLGSTLVHYPTTWAIPFFLLPAFLLAAVLYIGLNGKWLSPAGMAHGGLALFLSLVTGPLLLLLIQWAVIQPLLRSAEGVRLGRELSGDSLLSNGFRWGSVILTVIASGLWVGLFRRTKRVRMEDFATGAYGILFIAAGVTSVIFPEVSYLFVWPLSIGLMAVLLQFLSNGVAWPGLKWVAAFGWLAAATAAIGLFVPGILIATLSVEIEMIYLVPAFMAVLGGFMVGPALMVLERG